MGPTFNKSTKLSVPIIHQPPQMNRPSQLDADAEWHDKLVRAHGGEEDPDALRVILQSHGQTLKDGVQAQRQDCQEVPGRSRQACINITFKTTGVCTLLGVAQEMERN